MNKNLKKIIILLCSFDFVNIQFYFCNFGKFFFLFSMHLTEPGTYVIYFVEFELKMIEPRSS